MMCLSGCPRGRLGKTRYCRLCLAYFNKNSKLNRGKGYIKFTDQFEVKDEHWLWTGVILPNGYGLFQRPDKIVEVAHRASYIHYVGQIPAGLELDHLCRIRNCVNPKHLEPVTRKENIKRISSRSEQVPHDLPTVG